MYTVKSLRMLNAYNYTRFVMTFCMDMRHIVHETGKSACFKIYPTAWQMLLSNCDSGVIVLIVEPLISIMSQSVEKMIFD